MKLLISQQEIKKPPFFFVNDALERAWYHVLAGHTLIPAPNIPTWDFESIEFDAVVFTGGNDSVARHLTEDRLFKIADLANKPIVGFCHGAFVINDIAAGINDYIDGHVGQDHLITMEEKTHQVNSFHSQYIRKLAPGYEVLATDRDGNPEAFRHVFKKIWGVVWHPERMEKVLLPSDLADFLRTDLSSF